MLKKIICKFWKATTMHLMAILLIVCITGCHQIDNNLFEENIYIPNEDSYLADSSEYGNYYCVSGLYESLVDMYDDADTVIQGEVVSVNYYKLDRNIKTDDEFNYLTYYLNKDKNALLKGYVVRIKIIYKGEQQKGGKLLVITSESLNTSEFSKDYFDKAYGLFSDKYAYFRNEEVSRKYDKGNEILTENYPFMSENMNISIGDEMLLFLAKGSEDTFENKKVYTYTPLSYEEDVLGTDSARIEPYIMPEGVYVSLGLGMGTFKLNNKTYIRQGYYQHDMNILEEYRHLLIKPSRFDSDELTQEILNLS